MLTYNVEFVSSALQKTNFYHNAADRELCGAPRKWLMLVFVPLIGMCGLSSLSLVSPHIFLHCLSLRLCVCTTIARFLFGMGSDVSEQRIDGRLIHREGVVL